MQRMVRGGAWAVLGRIAGMGFSVLTTVVLARLLDPKDMGAYFIALTVATTASILGRFGLERPLVRHVAAALELDEPARVRQAFRDTLIVAVPASLVAGGTLLLATPWLGRDIFEAPNLSRIGLVISLWLIALSAQGLVAEGFRALHDIRAAILFGGTIASGAILAALVALRAFPGAADLSAVAWVSALTTGVVALMGGLLLLGRVRSLPRTSPLPPAPVALAREGFPMFVTNSMHYILQSLGLWLVGAYSSEQDAALYGTAARLVFLVGTWLTIVNQVLPPIIVELTVQDNRPALERVLRSTAAIAALPGLFALFAFSLAGGPILGLLYGQFYEAGSPLLFALCTGQVVILLTGSSFFALSLTGHHNMLMWIAVGGGVAAAAFGFLAAQLWGAIGIAWTLSAITALERLAMLVAARWSCGIWTHADFTEVSNGVRRVRALWR